MTPLFLFTFPQPCHQPGTTRMEHSTCFFSAAVALHESEITAQAEDAGWFRYALNHSISMRDSGSQWVAYKNLLLTGSGVANIPVTPPMPAPEPPNVDFGILTRFRELVRRIKAAPAYTEAIGEALGVIGPESADPDLATLAPQISLRVSGGQVEVVWNKGKQESVEIQVDRGAGWQFLAMDTRPNHTDTTPFPTPAATWKHRAIYCKDAQKLGQWSNVAEITVGG